MEKRQIIKLIFRVVLPPILVIALFAVAIGAVIIPATEDALMQKKRDVIQAIVMSATSIIDKHAQMEKEGQVTKEEAQEAALAEMRALRYGADNKDYLWIIDLEPAMVMHPYFPELEGKLLNQYADTSGKLFFIEAARIAGENGEGYVEYMWPRNDNMSESVPKLSYIRLFQPWGWVVGSGIYLDDVNSEIRSVTIRLVKISIFIGLIVLTLLLYMIGRGLKSEKARRTAEIELLKSREKYQALAHASGEMLFLTIDGKIVGANRKACELIGKSEDKIISCEFSELFENPLESGLLSEQTISGGANSVEMMMKGAVRPERVLLSAEHAVVHGSPAIMYAGFISNTAKEQEKSLVSHSAFQKTGFGALQLDHIRSGKIVDADSNARMLLLEDQNQPLLGTDIRDLLHELDSSRLFIQLDKEKTAENMILRLSGHRNPDRCIRLWAAVGDEASKERVTVIIQDETVGFKASQLENSLLSELLSHDRLLPPGIFGIKSHNESLGQDKHFHKTVLALKQFINMGIDVENVTSISTCSINNIFSHAVKKAIDESGPPPCGFSLIAFGSIGRQEPTLDPDQDTAIIYEDDEKDNDSFVNEYFVKLGERVTTLCGYAGLPPCNAGNTAANPKWVKSLSAWREQFSKWIHTSEPEDLVLLNIFFDFKTMAGDHALSEALRNHIFNEVKNRPAFLFNLAFDTLNYRTPADLFGRIRSDSRSENCVNLKGTMLHFVNFTRIYSLKYRVEETNTLKRLEALRELGGIPSDTSQDTIGAWKFLMELRLKNQISSMEMNFPQENILILDGLSSWEESLLKKAMNQVTALQKRLSLDIMRMG